MRMCCSLLEHSTLPLQDLASALQSLMLTILQKANSFQISNHSSDRICFSKGMDQQSMMLA